MDFYIKTISAYEKYVRRNLQTIFSIFLNIQILLKRKWKQNLFLMILSNADSTLTLNFSLLLMLERTNWVRNEKFIIRSLHPSITYSSTWLCLARTVLNQ